jgi:hypothetical protein
MGGGGVLVFLPAVAVLLLDWWEREERAAGRADARLDRALRLERRSGMPDAHAEGLPTFQEAEMRRRYPTGAPGGDPS